jgi:hypothetical protein
MAELTIRPRTHITGNETVRLGSAQILCAASANYSEASYRQPIQPEGTGGQAIGTGVTSIKINARARA